VTKDQSVKSERLSKALFLALCSVSETEDQEVREAAIYRTLDKLENMGMTESAAAVRKLTELSI
jgi:Fe2+ or Zn2+ uptake regulation protein